MAKSKRPGKKPPAPRAARPNPRATPMRDQIRAKADTISAAVARVDQKINRILLVLLLVLAVLWIAKPAAFGLICRYAIIMLLGLSMTLNGLVGYRKSRWAGFFLMVFGTILFISNLFMLASQFAA